MPWMRGSLGAPDGAEADGKRVVWENGGEQPLYSPNSDAFWEWTTRYIVEYAKMSVELPAIMGVFLDYENYAPGIRMGNLYSLSFDADIIARFALRRALRTGASAGENRTALRRFGITRIDEGDDRSDRSGDDREAEPCARTAHQLVANRVDARRGKIAADADRRLA